MQESVSEKLLRPCVLSPSPSFELVIFWSTAGFLKFLLLELQKAGDHIIDLEIPLLSPVISRLG